MMEKAKEICTTKEVKEKDDKNVILKMEFTTDCTVPINNFLTL